MGAQMDGLLFEAERDLARVTRENARLREALTPFAAVGEALVNQRAEAFAFLKNGVKVWDFQEAARVMRAVNGGFPAGIVTTVAHDAFEPCPICGSDEKWKFLGTFEDGCIAQSHHPWHDDREEAR